MKVIGRCVGSQVTDLETDGCTGPSAGGLKQTTHLRLNPGGDTYIKAAAEPRGKNVWSFVDSHILTCAVKTVRCAARLNNQKNKIHTKRNMFRMH